MNHYSPEFFKIQREGSSRSAKEVVPLVVELVQPQSVVDVGCGVGTWLSEFLKQGVADIQGIDGEYVEKKMLKIPPEKFLASNITEPIRFNRKFDLVVCLEVAEHLPAEYADLLVDSLAALGPVILFSAAIPFQGGVHHVNEQWPDYWASRFQKRNFTLVDCLRPKIWHNEKVQICYRQNTFLFVHHDHLTTHPTLKGEFEKSRPSPMALVHPLQYLSICDLSNVRLKRIFFQMPRRLLQSAKRLFQKREGN